MALPDVAGAQGNRFCLLTITGEAAPSTEASFLFRAESIADIKDPERRFSLTVEDIRLLNPNTRTCPIFRTRRDAEITKAVYRRLPVLIDENDPDGNPWGITFLRMFDMSNDSHLFRTHEELEADSWKLEGNVFHKDEKRYLPLYEAKMFHQFDHRFGDYALASKHEGAVRQIPQAPSEKLADPHYVSLPRYWAPEKEVKERLGNHWSHPWLFGFRSVASGLDERTGLLAILPPAAAGNSIFLITSTEDDLAVVLPAGSNSFVFDYILRQKIGGVNLNFFIIKQLPVLSPDAYDAQVPWDEAAVLRDWIAPRVLELTYTAWDLEPFARDLGYEGPPFRWDPERRFLLRCELDAAFFHLYGIGHDDVDYIMETFPIVKRKDEAAHGEYRTKRVILEIYDQMARATETGEPYQTPLDPPPVDLDLPASEPATVTPLRPRTEPEPEQAPPQEIVAEDRGDYAAHTRQEAGDPERNQAEALVDAILKNADFSQLPPGHRGNLQSTLADEQQPNLLDENDVEASAVRPASKVPSLYEAALALHACLPDGEKVEREPLLHEVARQLGHQKLTRKVRRALNKALNAENNAGRLKTDWERVWKPRK